MSRVSAAAGPSHRHRTSKLDPYKPTIAEWLQQDPSVHAPVIAQRLRPLGYRDDNAGRQEIAARVGLGFKIPPFVPKPIVRKVRKNRKALDIAVAG
jgi:hypothetical protein